MLVEYFLLIATVTVLKFIIIIIIIEHNLKVFTVAICVIIDL